MRDEMNGVPVIGDRESQMKQAIAAQLADMSREIYCRVIAADIGDSDIPFPTKANMMTIAQHSHDAAKAFYEGLGVLKFNDEATNQG